MKRVYAKYTHSTIGFPGIVLNWHEENGEMEMEGYVTINGVIQPEPYRFREENTALHLRITQELAYFDRKIREQYCNDPSVQG